MGLKKADNAFGDSYLCLALLERFHFLCAVLPPWARFSFEASARTEIRARHAKDETALILVAFVLVFEQLAHRHFHQEPTSLAGELKKLLQMAHG